MKLYSGHGSCSSASHIALIEAGLDAEIIKVDLRGDRTLPDGRQYSEVNPKGYVPTLELDNGELLTENVAILQYIADLAPESGLAPANGTMQRYRLQEWLAFLNSEVHKGCGLLFNPISDDTKKLVLERLSGRFAYLDERLQGAEYLMGEQFTVADSYLFIILSWAPMLNIDLSPYTNITAFQARCAERDSIKKYKAATEA